LNKIIRQNRRKRRIERSRRRWRGVKSHLETRKYEEKKVEVVVVVEEVEEYYRRKRKDRALSCVR
jgi:hypothetical protein